MTKLKDSSFMPFGKYKGDRMENVPANYLLWLYERKKCNIDVLQYIKENLEVLHKEIKDNDTSKNNIY